MVRRRKAVRYDSSDLAVEKCVKAIDRGIGAVLKQSAVSCQRERDAVVPSPLGDLAYVTTRGHHDRYKAMPKSVECYVVQPGTKHGRPQDSASPGAEERATCRCGEHKGICSLVNKLRERCCSSRRMTDRATGTERFERVVLGSLSKVTGA
jgi:hypothetical protein